METTTPEEVTTTTALTTTKGKTTTPEGSRRTTTTTTTTTTKDETPPPPHGGSQPPKGSSPQTGYTNTLSKMWWVLPTIILILAAISFAVVIRIRIAAMAVRNMIKEKENSSAAKVKKATAAPTKKQNNCHSIKHPKGAINRERGRGHTFRMEVRTQTPLDSPTVAR